MIIENDGTGKAGRAQYNFRITKWDNSKAIRKKGRVENFDNKKRGSWDLTLNCLQLAVGYRNEEINRFPCLYYSTQWSVGVYRTEC